VIILALFRSRTLFQKSLPLQQSICVMLGILACVLALIGFIRAIPMLLQVPDQLDFGAYYVAAYILNTHGELYQSNMIAVAAENAGHVHATSYIYPPFWAVLIRPLALLPYSTAEVVWLVCNVLFLCLSVVLMVHLLQLPFITAAPLVGVLFLMPAVYDTMLLGQVSLLITLLLVGVLTLSVVPISKKCYQNEVLAGVLLGLAVAIKVYPAVMILVYIVHRRMKVLFTTGLTVSITVLIGILFGGGWSSIEHWLTDVMPAVSTMSPFPSNQSIRGVITRFFSTNQFQVPVLTSTNFMSILIRPLIDNALLGRLISWIGILSTISVTVLSMIWRVRQDGQTYVSLVMNFATAIAAMLLITPVVWDFYFVHALIPMVVLAWYNARVSLSQLTLIIVCLLLVLQRYWRFMLLFAQTPWLMCFGFLGIGLLWFTLQRTSFHQYACTITQKNER
jgi:hypothetical protein